MASSDGYRDLQVGQVFCPGEFGNGYGNWKKQPFPGSFSAKEGRLISRLRAAPAGSAILVDRGDSYFAFFIERDKVRGLVRFS